MKINAIYILLFFSISSVTLYGQGESSAFTATGRGGVATTFINDYQTIGINPANLGWQKSFRDPKFSFGMFETNFTFFAEPLTRRDIKDAIFNAGQSSFSQLEKLQAADKISDKAFSVNAETMLLGGSMKLPNKKGGIAFSMRDKIQVFTRVNRAAAELMFLGSTSGYFSHFVLSTIGSDGFNTRMPNPNYNPNFPEAPDNPYIPVSSDTTDLIVGADFDGNEATLSKNYPTLLNGTRISAVWYREYNFAYGVQLLDSYDFSMYVGVGAKILQGFLNIELQFENNELVESTIAHSPTFGLDFGDDSDVAQSPTFRGTDDNASLFNQLLFPESVGTGFGLDLGITMVIKRNLYIGASLTNLGSLTWNGNVAEVATDGSLQRFVGVGLDDFNILANKEGAFQFAGDKSPFSWEGSADSRKVKLPTVFRVGASYELFRTFHFGADVLIPTTKVSGNLENPLFAIGTDFHPFKLFKFSGGVNFGGNNDSKINIPVGITYIGRKGYYEAGIATRDITTYFADLGGGSTISFASGFLRFKI